MSLRERGNSGPSSIVKKAAARSTKRRAAPKKFDGVVKNKIPKKRDQVGGRKSKKMMESAMGKLNVLTFAINWV